VLGYGVAALAILGLLHVVNGPEKIMADFDRLGKAGGWFGALVGEPLRKLLADGGAIVVFVMLILLGVLVITGWSMKTLLGHAGHGVSRARVPLGRAHVAPAPPSATSRP
jgi:hypothetical protein